MYMKLKDGKSKVLTLSYDDGMVEDIRLIQIMDKYGLKGTFNINTGLYSPEDKECKANRRRMKLSEAVALYRNSAHEVAVHGYTHPYLDQLKSQEVLVQILKDRENIEKQYGVITRGMAYPYGTYNDNVIECLRQCGIAYSRAAKSTEGFSFPQNWLTLNPTCHHGNERLMEIAKRFVEENPYLHNNWMFYLWGHSFEFTDNDNWEVIEEFAEYIGGRNEIWYATNIEIYDYVKAYESLRISIDKTIVHNPSDIDVWFFENGKTYTIKAGETINI